jgi:hypothetical protein
MDYLNFIKKIIVEKKNVSQVKILYDKFKKLDYNEIFKLITITTYFYQNSVILHKILDSLKYNPNKTLIFNTL